MTISTKYFTISCSNFLLVVSVSQVEGGSHQEVKAARLVRFCIGDFATDATVVQLDLVAADLHGRALSLPWFFLALPGLWCLLLQGLVWAFSRIHSGFLLCKVNLNQCNATSAFRMTLTIHYSGTTELRRTMEVTRRPKNASILLRPSATQRL